MNPKLSVVIPVYDVEAYLPRCMDSVVEQTLCDIEIICVDDESPDNSLAILRDYAARDSRIRIISQKNRGLGGARNTGFDAATGEYILFVDSDDWVDPDFCEKLYEAAIRTDADIACASMPKIRSTHVRWTMRFDREEVIDDALRKFEACNCPPDFYVMNRIFRREVLLRLGLRFRERAAYEDIEYTMRALCEMGRLVTVPGPCYRYVVRGTSITKSRQTPQKQLDKYNAHKQFIAYANAHGISLAHRHRSITKRFWALGAFTVLKVKERDGVLTWRVFDFIPVFSKKVK